MIAGSSWTPVALSGDVPPGTTLPGHLLGQDVAIWRGASGTVAVWPDRCPHRGMRLSHGFVRGDALSCIYHGWRYDASGRCIRIPAHPELAPPSAVRVGAFAAAETSGVVWAAMPDPAPSGPPPEFAGCAGFRTLRVEAPAAALDEPAAERDLGPCHAVVLVQGLTDDTCALHVLAPTGADAATLDALSASLEALRRRAEAGRAAA